MSSLLEILSDLSMILASGAVSGVSRSNMYQGSEPEEIRKLKKF